jgi:predicted RNA binding protein YcfA (HicA-like mRNA interferase family)
MVKYNALFAALKKEGWYIVRQKGSHVILRHPSRKEQLTIPYHAGSEVKKGLLKAILKQANIKFEQR